jgi:hypothetical protein
VAAEGEEAAEEGEQDGGGLGDDGEGERAGIEAEAAGLAGAEVAVREISGGPSAPNGIDLYVESSGTDGPSGPFPSRSPFMLSKKHENPRVPTS